MSDLDDLMIRVVMNAAAAYAYALDHPHNPERPPVEAHVIAMRSAIRAADRERAEQGLVLVRREDLEAALYQWSSWNNASGIDVSGDEPYRRLTAALGDGETGMGDQP